MINLVLFILKYFSKFIKSSLVKEIILSEKLIIILYIIKYNLFKLFSIELCNSIIILLLFLNNIFDNIFEKLASSKWDIEILILFFLEYFAILYALINNFKKLINIFFEIFSFNTYIIFSIIKSNIIYIISFFI